MFSYFWGLLDLQQQITASHLPYSSSKIYVQIQMYV
jgi:hypothetical protein